MEALSRHRGFCRFQNIAASDRDASERLNGSFKCRRMKRNKVNEEGYGDDVTTACTSFYLTVVLQNGDDEQLYTGDNGNPQKWTSRVETLTVRVRVTLIDAYSQKAVKSRKFPKKTRIPNINRVIIVAAEVSVASKSRWKIHKLLKYLESECVDG